MSGGELPPTPSLKGSDVLSFQASIHFGRGLKDDETQLFHCSDRESMSLRAFHQSDKSYQIMVTGKIYPQK